MAEFNHITVLLNEAVEGLDIDPTGVYVDATLGGGGHTKKILEQLTTGHLYSFDQDQVAIEYNKQQLSEAITAGKLTLIKSNFKDLKSALSDVGVNQIDGIVYDLGVSSPQFDDGDRGFSYRFDARLDMRMDQNNPLDAWEVVNHWSYEQLVRIFYRYGEEKFSKKIARSIERIRETTPIDTTGQLAEIIKDAIPMATRRHGGHPAKKVFQAIRIAVNDELAVLESSLEQAIELVAIDGRISVITFQSLEDRLVKTMFKEITSLPELPPNLPIIPKEMEPNFKNMTPKPILPKENELEDNHRSHSAKLRIVKRISNKN